jgi:hypothetical protein
MKTTKILLSLVIVATFFASCSQGIVGNWSIQKYQSTIPDQQDIILSNVGTINFNRNGTGEKNVSYTIFDLTKTDITPFTWTISENLLTIVSDGSEFSKTWIQVENQKSFQYLTSTDGQNRVQILELRKGK